MEMIVKSHQPLADDVFELNLSGPFPWKKVQPGQFVQVQVDRKFTHVLRRPISIAETNATAEELTLVYRVVGSGTQQLSAMHPGEYVDVLGPLGSGYVLPKFEGEVVLVGGGLGIPPLYELARVLKARSTTFNVVLGWRTSRDSFWIDKFEDLAETLTVMTDDGTLGSEGNVIDALELKEQWSEGTQVMACGPKPMLRSLQQWCQEHGFLGQMSLEERMACGIGACTGCVCTTIHGLRRVCADGPVFPMEEVIL